MTVVPGEQRERISPLDTSCRRCALGSLAVFLVLSALPALGQSVPATEVETEATAAVFPSAVAVAVIGTGPVLDGDVLGDPAWIDVPVATGFIQTQPDEGQPATERTEVRVLFDDDTIISGSSATTVIRTASSPPRAGGTPR